MTRFAATFLMLLIVGLVCLNAQEHMLFMKTPINGAMNEFVIQMKSKGFVHDYTGKDGMIMSGVFAGKDCDIVIVCTPITKTVWKVAVNLKREYTSWSSLKIDYWEMVNSYISKYGNPTGSFDFFGNPYEEGDGYEMQAVRMGKCYYRTFWTLERGTIAILIDESAKISIWYEDKLNTEKLEKERKLQIDDDI